MDKRDELIYKAQLAEKAERYDEMVGFMKELAGSKSDMDVEERNLLSVAYKNSVGSRRSSWRILMQLEQKQRSKGNDAGAECAKEYRSKVEEELRSICNEVLPILENAQSVSATAEAKVFFAKMRGDYQRYLAEFSEGEDRTQCAAKGQASYDEAMAVAKGELPAMNAIRLGLALNHSVFFYEILEKQDEACGMAQEAYEAAVAELENFDDENYRDSTLIMQLIKDNLALWKNRTT